MRASKIYPIKVPASGGVQLLVEGDFFKIVSATGDVEVRGDGWGTLGTIKAGQGLRRNPYKRLEFVDKSGADNLLQVLVGDSDFVDDRVTGEVSVIDGNRARTLTGVAFLGNVTFAGAAGQYTHLQLWNPAGGTKNLIVGQVQLNSTNAQAVSMKPHASPLATLSASPLSKRLGGAAPGAQLRTEGSAAYIPSGPDMATFNLVANGTTQYRPTEPIVVPPGYGIVLFANNFLNTPLSALFDFYEDSTL